MCKCVTVSTLSIVYFHPDGRSLDVNIPEKTVPRSDRRPLPDPEETYHTIPGNENGRYDYLRASPLEHDYMPADHKPAQHNKNTRPNHVTRGNRMCDHVKGRIARDIQRNDSEYGDDGYEKPKIPDYLDLDN